MLRGFGITFRVSGGFTSIKRKIYILWRRLIQPFVLLFRHRLISGEKYLRFVKAVLLARLVTCPRMHKLL